MNINNFFDSNDIRKHISTPFQFNGRTMATNGHVFLSMPQHGDYQQLDGKGLDLMIDTINDFPDDKEFMPMPNDLVWPWQYQCSECDGTGKATHSKCKECDGSGELEFKTDFNSYECGCKSCECSGIIIISGGNKNCTNCDGTGKIYSKGAWVCVFGIFINPKYLNYIINEPELKAYPRLSERKLFFRTGDYAGIIMGVRK